MMRIVFACALAAIAACAARTPAIEPIRTRYQFMPGEILRFRVESHLSVDMSGTHPALLLKGMTEPLAWDLEGEFDNVVLDVDKSGDAQIERRVRDLRSSGHYQDEKFGLVWNRARDGAVPDEASSKSLMDRFAANMIAVPMRFRVDGRGISIPDEPAFRRLVMRRGMMYWPIEMDRTAWISREEMAVPVLHDKVQLVFQNSIREVSGGTAFIVAPVALKNDDKRPPGYIVSGGAKAEFDIASGRLKLLELEVRIAFSGKTPVPGGGEGDLRGVVTYRETQRLVQ